MNKQIDYTLEWKANGTRKILIVAKSDDTVIHSDTIDIQQAKHRDQFAKSLELLGCDAEAVRTELLAVAGEHSRTMETPDPVVHDSREIDVTDIHRPERFILDGINGLTVPIFLAGHSGVSSRWVCYVIADGKRQKLEIGPVVRIDGRTIFIQPIPADPDQNNVTGWSQDSRQQWLKGKPAVDPAELFQRIVQAVDNFVEFDRDQRHGIIATVSCWIVLTYCYHVWPAVPYLFLNGPAGSGKSTTFDVLQRLCFRVFKTDMPSPSTIFRTLHETGGTLLYDEAERLKQTQADDIGRINAMLLAGYRRGGSADLMEKIGDGFKRTSFQVFGPKAIANINGLPAPLQSRCIEITMQKADPDSPKPNRRIADYDWQSIVDDLHVVTLEHGNDWRDMASENRPVEGLPGRENQLWKPLVAIGRWFESHGVGDLADRLIQFATDSTTDAKELQTPEIELTLLSILADAVRDGRSVTAKDILSKARDDDSVTFKNWTPEAVSRRLRAYGLKAVKSGSSRLYRDALVKLLDIQRRHGLDFGLIPDA